MHENMAKDKHGRELCAWMFQKELRYVLLKQLTQIFHSLTFEDVYSFAEYSVLHGPILHAQQDSAAITGKAASLVER
jgi:hypothetical protein